MVDMSWYLSKLNLTSAHIQPITHEDSFSGILYKITLQNDLSYVLKIHRDETAHARECFWLKQVEGLIHAPKLIDQVDAYQENPPALLMEHIEGETLTRKTLTDRHARLMGELLATLHLIQKNNGDTTTHKQMLAPLLNKRVADLAHTCRTSLDTMTSAALELYCQKHMLSDLDITDLCILHGDFKPANVIIKDNIIAGLIDWEMAEEGYSTMDFGAMDRVWAKSPHVRKPFLEGYSNIRPLPNLERTLPFARLLRILV